MKKNVLLYQKAFNSIVDRLKTNVEVLAVLVFGSMVTGDLWAESDIDLFVVLDKKMDELKNIYTEEKDIAVHIKLMSKEKFIQLYSEDLKGGFIHRIFASSRLVFSKDKDITSTYDNGRYYPDLDRERWTMVYLGIVLKRLSICKKYLHNEGLYTAYSAAVRCIEEFAKLYVNFSGYMISKDAMTMAMNLDENFKNIVDELFNYKPNTKEVITSTIEFIENSIDENIKNMTGTLMNFMRQSESFFSAEDIKNDKLFQNFEIEIEEILDKLWEKKIIKKESRDYKTEDNKLLFRENVYFI
ncbi:MAG: nucleotidyltransferase domain-containing protein [Clostridiaceae bacterium]|nr:nucleotidyltransferase domain-containing protein [Clostridiaceae bacterium]